MATAAVEATISKQALRNYLGSMWERDIKKQFDVDSGDICWPVPFDFYQPQGTP
jgi:hypothetical protein